MFSDFIRSHFAAGALLAHKVCVHIGAEISPSWVVLVDPPPAGPCTRRFDPSWEEVAWQLIRLSKEVAGMTTERVYTSSNDFNPGDGYMYAIEATEQMASLLGQVQFNRETIYRTMRRMEVYRHSMMLWHCQDDQLVPYSPQPGGGVILITSSGRWDFFRHLYDEAAGDNLAAYCSTPSLRINVAQASHTQLVQDVCTNRLPHVTTSMESAIRNGI